MYITRKHFTVLMLALLMLLLTLPVMALGEANTAVEQEVLVPAKKQEEPAASQPQKAAQPAEEGEIQEKEEDKDQA